ncbi:MAG: sigma-70 family RNA polymerase sigma factor [Isosphaeraceae bacterium]
MSTGALGGTLRHLRDLFGDGTTVGLGDGQLLARFAHSGDQAAFEALVARHGPMVLATCRAILKHEHDVEDAFQATFLVLARKARSVRAGDALGGWLHRVAYRAAVQASGARRRRRRHEAEASAMAGRQAHTHPAGPEPDLPAIVHEELDRLADRHRLAVVLCDLEGLTYEQAAGQLHWTEPTLRHRLVRGRQKLRERLIRRGITAGIGFGFGMSLDTAGAASLLGSAGIRASVPAALARSAVVAATGGSASIGADAIASFLLGGLAATTRLKVAAVCLAGVAATAVISTGIVAIVGPGRANEQRAADHAKAPAVPPPTSRDDDPKGKPVPASPTGSIEGRILDLEGRPVAGARIRAVWIWSPRSGDLGQWLEETRKRGRYPGQGMTPKESTLAAAAGSDGRFRLDGVGPDQLVELEVSGPSIATSHLYVAGRDGADLRVPVETFRGINQVIYHARRFEHAVEPTKPVEGMVTDVDTGRPLARVGLRAAVFDSSSLIPAEGVAAVTDANGHYRIEGLPPAPAYRIFAQPGPEMPYPRATLKTSGSSRAFEPLRFDFALRRAIILRGRVTDKVTGRPVPGYVHVYEFANNPHISDYLGYRMGQPTVVPIQQDGRFETVALPGRGVIGFRARDEDRYRGYLGAEAIAEYDPKTYRFETAPYFPSVHNYHVLAELRLDPKSSTAEVNLQVDPGRTIEIRPIDPEGRPVAGTSATGVGDLFGSIAHEQPSPTIAIHALDPSHPRRVTVRHPGRKLVGSVYLRGNETGPLTLRLQPWGTITGRIVDDDGEPRRDLRIMSAGNPDPERPERQAVFPGGDIGGGVRLGPDGRFRIEGLVPGLVYGGDAVAQGVMLTGRLFRDVVVKPGEVRNLGDLKVIPYRPEQ